MQQVIDIIPITQFNKTVRKIAYNQPNGSIRVDCEDGASFTADHLICTVSLGVLKERHLSMFEPLLPLTKCINIDGLMYGTVDKIYLEFERPFWSEDWGGFSILWKLEQLKELREDPVNGDWLEGLMGFFTFNTHQPNIICGWIAGAMAIQMEQKSDANVKAGCEKVLRMILKHMNVPSVKAMRRYDSICHLYSFSFSHLVFRFGEIDLKGKHFFHIFNLHRTKWHSNPNFRGSYSSHTLKSNALKVSAEQLMEPINDSNGKPLIQFAGEATNVYHYGCVHGAIETGWREADRLIELYK